MDSLGRVRTMKSQPYRCWCPDHKINEQEAKTIYSYFERDAAEQYAEYLFSFFDEKFSSVEVCVKEANNHYAETKIYNVRVVVKPTFNANKVGGYGNLR